MFVGPTRAVDGRGLTWPPRLLTGMRARSGCCCDAPAMDSEYTPPPARLKGAGAGRGAARGAAALTWGAAWTDAAGARARTATMTTCRGGERRGDRPIMASRWNAHVCPR